MTADRFSNSQVKDLEKKTGVESTEKKIEESSSSSGGDEGKLMKELIDRPQVEWVSENANLQASLSGYLSQTHIRGGVVPKSQEDAIAALRASHGQSDNKTPQKLHEEIAPFKDDRGLDIETARETGVKYSGREEKPVPESHPELDELAEQKRKQGKGPEAVKKAIEEQEKKEGGGSKL